MKNQSAYLQAVFQYSPADKPEEFWVVTAYNPFGEEASPSDNLEADNQLKQCLEERELHVFRVIGLSPDERHAEPGWGIACDEATAIELGRQFRQDAVFHFHDGLIELVRCDNQKRQPLENPESLIRDPRELRQFTLWVGSAAGGHIDPLQYTGICTRAGALFDNFTVQRAEGCYRSRFEDSLLVHIATRKTAKVIELGHILRCFLNQEGVGISCNGVYQRLRDWSDDEQVLEAFTPHSAP